MIYSRLLQESKLAANQPRWAPHHVIPVTTSEGLAQGSNVATTVGFEPATLHNEGTKHHHWTTTPPIFKLIDRIMITSTVWTDDWKLLRKSNLSTRQPRRAPITLFILFNQRRRLAKEGLVNLTGLPGSNTPVPLNSTSVCYPLLHGPTINLLNCLLAVLL